MTNAEQVKQNKITNSDIDYKAQIINENVLDNELKYRLMVEIIKRKMKEIGINARQLAQLAEVGKSFVYDILNGKSKNPTSNKLNAIAKVLGISISYLINSSSDSINYDHYVPVYNLERIHDANILLSKSFCIDKLTDKSKLYTYCMYDDSMSPTIQNNEIVIIKQYEESESIKSGIFLIKDKFGSVVRRLEPILGTNNIKITPDNNKYSTYIKSFDEIDIIGRIVFSFKEM